MVEKLLRLGKLGRELGVAAGDLDDQTHRPIVGGGWSGPAASTALGRIKTAINCLEAAQAEVSAVGSVLEGLAEAVDIARRSLRGAVGSSAERRPDRGRRQRTGHSATSLAAGRATGRTAGRRTLGCGTAGRPDDQECAGARDGGGQDRRDRARQAGHAYPRRGSEDRVRHRRGGCLAYRTGGERGVDPDGTTRPGRPMVGASRRTEKLLLDVGPRSPSFPHTTTAQKFRSARPSPAENSDWSLRRSMYDQTGDPQSPIVVRPRQSGKYLATS